MSTKNAVTDDHLGSQVEGEAEDGNGMTTDYTMNVKPVVAVERGDRPTGRFKDLGGSDHDDFNGHLLVNTAMALPQAASAGEITASAMLSLKPEDTVEGLLGAQLLAANDASLELYRRAWIPGQPTELMERYLNLANKTARTMAVLTDTLDRHRGRA